MQHWFVRGNHSAGDLLVGRWHAVRMFLQWHLHCFLHVQELHRRGGTGRFVHDSQAGHLRHVHRPLHMLHVDYRRLHDVLEQLWRRNPDKISRLHQHGHGSDGVQCAVHWHNARHAAELQPRNLPDFVAHQRMGQLHGVMRRWSADTHQSVPAAAERRLQQRGCILLHESSAHLADLQHSRLLCRPMELHSLVRLQRQLRRGYADQNPDVCGFSDRRREAHYGLRFNCGPAHLSELQHAGLP